MVDGARLCDALSTIRDHGGGAVRRTRDCRGGYAWRSGHITLDSHAITQLSSLGWLRPPDSNGAAMLDDSPLFERDVTVH